MTKEEKQQKREERIERAKDFAGHCVEIAADTIITTALAIVVVLVMETKEMEMIKITFSVYKIKSYK